MADPRPLTREELARFLPNQRAIRAFEKLFDLIPDDLDSLRILIEELSNEVSDVDQKANAALATASEMPDVSIINSDYTTANDEKIVASAAITVTLNQTPNDGEKVIVVATNGRVNIDGNGKNISGRDGLVISQNYTSLSMVYNIELNEWFIQ